MCSEIEFFGQWVNGPLVSSTVFSALSEPFGLKRRCNSIYTLLQSCLFMEEGEFSSQFQLPTSNNHPNAANIGGGKNGRRCLLRLTLLTTTKTRVLMLEKTSCKISWKPWPDRSCNFVIFPSIRHPLHFPHCITQQRSGVSNIYSDMMGGGIALFEASFRSPVEQFKVMISTLTTAASQPQPQPSSVGVIGADCWRQPINNDQFVFSRLFKLGQGGTHWVWNTRH